MVFEAILRLVVPGTIAAAETPTTAAIPRPNWPDAASYLLKSKDRDDLTSRMNEVIEREPSTATPPDEALARTYEVPSKVEPWMVQVAGGGAPTILVGLRRVVALLQAVNTLAPSPASERGPLWKLPTELAEACLSMRRFAYAFDALFANAHADVPAEPWLQLALAEYVKAGPYPTIRILAGMNLMSPLTLDRPEDAVDVPAWVEQVKARMRRRKDVGEEVLRTGKAKLPTFELDE